MDNNPDMAVLGQQFEDGEISMSEMLNQRDALQMQEMQQQMAIQQEQAAWNQQADKFFEQNRDIQKNPILIGAMQSALEDVAQNNPGMNNAELMELAGKQVKAVMATNNHDTNTPAAPAAATSAPTSAGSNAALDDMEGLELEDAVSSMTPAQQQAWLKGA